MTYLFVKAQQGGIHNSRCDRRLTRHSNRLTIEWMSKFVLCSL